MLYCVVHCIHVHVGNPALYNCTFPEMINDWRAKWSATKQTDPLFPFGFVQVSIYNRQLIIVYYPCIYYSLLLMELIIRQSVAFLA